VRFSRLQIQFGEEGEGSFAASPWGDFSKNQEGGIVMQASPKSLSIWILLGVWILSGKYIGSLRGDDPAIAAVEVAPTVLTEASPAQRHAAVNNALDVQASVIQNLRFARSADSAITTAVIIEGGTFTLELQPRSIRSPDFAVWEQDAAGNLWPVEPPPALTYLGTVRELQGAEVRASYHDGELQAIVRTPEGFVGIQPLSKLGVPFHSGEHAVYRELNWVNWRGVSCATDVGLHQALPFDGRAEPWENAPGRPAAAFSIAEIALDADYDFYVLNGLDLAATIQDMENVLNGVAVIYEAQLNISYQITSAIVRTTEPDPYTSTNHSTLLGEFVAHWNAPPQSSIRRDVAHMFTGKNLDGSVIGVAYIGAVCNQGWAYGLSQSRFTSSITSRIALTAHELGHNWNAAHCNGCTSCTNCCRIMCSGIGACSGILTSFGCQELAQISAFRDTRSCLSLSAGCTSSTECDDGLYCNGPEICTRGSCQTGIPPNCNDGVSCTTDSCNEAMDQCGHALNHALCNDGFFCNGVESCGTSGCVAGSPPCPVGRCDEIGNECVRGESGSLWMVFSDSTTVPGVGTVENEDVVSYDLANGTWSLVFDGSDVGLTNLAIDALAVVPPNNLLLSFTVEATLPGMTGGPNGTLLDDSDVVLFIPTLLGSTTAGVFLFAFDGSDLGLTTDEEDVDALSLSPDGRLVLSTVGPYSTTGVAGDDTDLLLFSPSTLGAATAGSFALLLNGADVGLTPGIEGVDGASLTSHDTFLLSTVAAFSVPGVNGADEDVLEFTPATLGATTSGFYTLFLDLSALGISTLENLAALEFVE